MKAAIDSEKVLKHHGKTFYFAQRFLGRKRGFGVARLYRFCRYIDDLADQSVDRGIAEHTLRSIRLQISAQHADDPIVADFLELAADWEINHRYALDLIDGVLMDLETVAIKDQAELIQYCYRVAGVVGLMMCPLLHADQRGERFALDLGIGMQLTNIARDVLYDAKRGRRYLPAEVVNGVSAEQIIQLAEKGQPPIQEGIRKILQLAESYYESGRSGFIYLPLRSRVSIAIAARTYRQIGVKLLRGGCQYWRGRTYTTLAEKIWLAFREIIWIVTISPNLKHPQHNSALHRDLGVLYPANKSVEDRGP